jgi:hypothetical protein
MQNSCSCRCIVKTTTYYRTHMRGWLNHRCKSILHIAWMVEWRKRIFENGTYWGYVIDTTEAEIGWERRTFHTEEWWTVHNGPRQQIATMFDNCKSIDGGERIARRTIGRTLCNWNNEEEDIGCWILVANYVYRCAWLLQILRCMSKNMRISNSKSCKAGHKSSGGTIHEMGTWFCGANQTSKKI